MRFVWKTLLGMVWCFGLLLSVNTHAMALFKNGDLVILYGSVVDGDERKLKEILTPEVKYLVLRSLAATDTYDIWALTKVIEAADITTVVHGFCGTGCTRMFLAGKERMFSGQGSLDVSRLIFGGFYFKNGSPDTKDYAYVSSRTEIPGKYMRQYLQNRGNTLAMFHPDAKTSRGASVLGCENAERATDCGPITDFDALSAGVITTKALFKSDFLKEAEDVPSPPSSGFAKISDMPPVPTLSDKCRGEIYQKFLRQSSPKAFAISDNNGCWYAAQIFRPRQSALAACKKMAGENHSCRLYAVDDEVVFVPFN